MHSFRRLPSSAERTGRNGIADGLCWASSSALGAGARAPPWRAGAPWRVGGDPVLLSWGWYAWRRAAGTTKGAASRETPVGSGGCSASSSGKKKTIRSFSSAGPQEGRWPTMCSFD